MDSRSFKDQADLQGLQGDAIIELITLDLQPIDSTIAPSDRYLRFCNWVETNGASVEYDSNEYLPIPYQTANFNIKTDGVPTNPSITVSNIGLEFTGLVNTWNDLIGAKLIRTRVLAKYLDNGSSPDSSAHWPDDVWFVQQKEDESKLTVTFVLSTAFDLDGVMLPRRRALRYTCPWVYRGEGCEYSGPPRAKKDDTLLAGSTNPLLDDLYGTYSAYKTAEAAYNAAIAPLNEAKSVTAEAQKDFDFWTAEQANPTRKFDKERYNTRNGDRYYVQGTGNSGSVTPSAVFWDDASVAGSFNESTGRYRSGDKKAPTFGNQFLFAIQRWEQIYSNATIASELADATTALATATAAQATAQATFDTAETNYNTTKAAYDTALAAWTAGGSPTDGGTDVCGKRLSSCRLRFFDEDLPWGGFPGLDLA